MERFATIAKTGKGGEGSERQRGALILEFKGGAFLAGGTVQRENRAPEKQQPLCKATKGEEEQPKKKKKRK